MHILFIAAGVAAIAWYLGRDANISVAPEQPTVLQQANENPYNLLTLPYNVPTPQISTPLNTSSQQVSSQTPTVILAPTQPPSDVDNYLPPCARHSCVPINPSNAQNSDTSIGTCMEPTTARQVKTLPVNQDWREIIIGGGYYGIERDTETNG